MSPILVLGVIAFYFLILVIISRLTSKGADTNSFFTANRQNPWYLVAFGMIGTSLSGVTFISVPGQVLTEQFSYFQLCLGYLLGYFIIGSILMPLYYKLNLISIYSYLENRFGVFSYKTGAAFFLLSRSIGSAARFYLVVEVLQFAVFEELGVPFGITAALALFLIWIYTYKGGIKTIVYTDTLQSFFMLASLILSFFLVANELDLNGLSLFSKVQESELSTVYFGDWLSKKYFWKQFLAGASIAVVMTGLDQDMMQKNLTCKSLKEAQLNMFSFSIILVIVNFLFLTLGAALYIYAAEKNIDLSTIKADQVYPLLALKYFHPTAGLIFLMGIIAATYASTDSAITALTTSLCVDFLNIEKKSEPVRLKLKNYTHIGFTVLTFFIVLLFKQFNDRALISTIFTLAGFTYGPLLGLYLFGLYMPFKPKDTLVPVVCVASPILSYILYSNSKEWFNGYTFGFEILLLNGLITFIGLWMFSKKISPQKVV